MADQLAERRYDLDWVRIGAFLLLILYHVGMYYVTWDWHVKSPYASAAIEPLMLLTSPWRLSLLFLVSGVATAYLLERQACGVPRPALHASARAARVRHARDRAAAVVSRGRREGAVRRRLRRVPGSLPHGLPGFLPRRRLPDPADLESPLVRRVSVGLHAAVVRVRARRSGSVPRLRAGSSGASSGLACCSGRSPISSRRACCSPSLPVDARPRRRLVQPCRVLPRVPARLRVGRRAGAVGNAGARALACARPRRARLGVPLRLARALSQRRRALPSIGCRRLWQLVFSAQSGSRSWPCSGSRVGTCAATTRRAAI